MLFVYSVFDSVSARVEKAPEYVVAAVAILAGVDWWLTRADHSWTRAEQRVSRVELSPFSLVQATSEFESTST